VDELWGCGAPRVVGRCVLGSSWVGFFCGMARLCQLIRLVRMYGGGVGGWVGGGLCSVFFVRAFGGEVAGMGGRSWSWVLSAPTPVGGGVVLVVGFVFFLLLCCFLRVSMLLS